MATFHYLSIDGIHFVFIPPPNFKQCDDAKSCVWISLHFFFFLHYELLGRSYWVRFHRHLKDSRCCVSIAFQISCPHGGTFLLTVLVALQYWTSAAIGISILETALSCVFIGSMVKHSKVFWKRSEMWYDWEEGMKQRKQRPWKTGEGVTINDGEGSETGKNGKMITLAGW